MNPLYYKGEPVTAVKPFIPLFEAELSPEMLARVMEAGRGWPMRPEHWGADHGTKKRQWPNPACSSYAAFNSFEPFATLQGKYGLALDMDPMEVHDLAMEIDGLAGGAANRQTTVPAGLEAVCTMANKAMGAHWVSWAKVPSDLIGAWQSVVSPVAVAMTWWFDWMRYSFIWKTLLWPHENPQPVANHAVALVGHLPKKRVGFTRPPVRAFEVHDSQGEKIWIEAAALVKSMRERQGYGFILHRDVVTLRGGREPEGFR